MLYKIGVLKNFAKFIGQALFSSLEVLRPVTLLKRDSSKSFFWVNFAKTFLQNTFWRMLLIYLMLLDNLYAKYIYYLK